MFVIASMRRCSCPLAVNIKELTTIWARFSTKEVKKPRVLKSEAQVARGRIIVTLQSLLDLDSVTATEAIKNVKSPVKVTPTLLKENYTNYLKSNVDPKILKKFPVLLVENELLLKIKEVLKLPYDLNDTICLISLPTPKLQSFVQYELKHGGDGKIATYSRLLGIKEQVVCEAFLERPFLCSISKQKLLKIISTLTEFGITTEEICNDLWVLRYSEPTIRNRLLMAKEANIGKLKTWMVRSTQEILDNYIQIRSERQSILKGSSVAEFLSKKLNCPVNVSKSMLARVPLLTNRSVSKISNMIDLIYQRGFRAEHIIRNPKVLSHSVKTIKDRLDIVESLGIKLDSLHQLTKSQDDFDLYVETPIEQRNLKKRKQID